MLTTTLALLLSAILSWLMIMLPALTGMKPWTPKGFKLASHNRDHAPLTQPPWVGRAERAARNMLENMVLFTALCVVALHTQQAGRGADLGATIFFWARLAYWFVYLAGVPYLRTALWATSVVGMVLIGVAACPL